MGCDKNRVDSEKLLSIIKSSGAEICDDLQEVQILVINTCAFLNESREEAINTVLDCSVYKSHKLEKIVLTGCLPQKFIGDIYKPLVEADVFLGTEDYGKFFEALELAYNNERVNYVGYGVADYCFNRVLTTPAHYAYLKIADGCNNKCTYCLIPKIRGKYVSYQIEDLIKETLNLGEISELILVAQDVTRYGIDLYGQKKLTELLKEITKLENVKSVRILYCYPDMIDDELIAEISQNPKIIKYLDIPLQHSEDTILRLMNRRGNRQAYSDLLRKLRTKIAGIAVRSTFITGFPGETKEDFEGLCDFVRQSRFENCGFFAFSREPETPAYKLKGQLKSSVKNFRVGKLYEIQSAISSEKLKAYVGNYLRVICDGIDYEKNCFVGRAYFQAPDIDGKVYFNANHAVQGEYYDVLIERSDEYDLFGRSGDYEL